MRRGERFVSMGGSNVTVIYNPKEPPIFASYVDKLTIQPDTALERYLLSMTVNLNLSLSATGQIQ
jgi:hypothetical protein